ncbi:uncharacterized protein LOC117606006 isoform X3 [Osmia lignaria lignaria]|uniref:uncharacterized protein LOC117606006 isoform X3 n=1 Tax=Osmia lignaria lignaria TaxID=1437193 RepID=UPI00402B45E0
MVLFLGPASDDSSVFPSRKLLLTGMESRLGSCRFETRGRRIITARLHVARSQPARLFLALDHCRSMWPRLKEATTNIFINPTEPADQPASHYLFCPAHTYE